MFRKSAVSSWFVLFCSSFSDSCSFGIFSLFFLLFTSSVFLLGLGSALVPSKLAGILTNDYCKYIRLATGKDAKGSYASSCVT